MALSLQYRPIMASGSIEQRVLSILEDNPRAPLSDIADRAGVARPTARKYIQKLENEGAIVGYSVEVDPKKIDHQCIAIVGIDLEGERYVEATTEIRQVEAVAALYTATGDHMLIAELRTRDSDTLNTILSEQILVIDGVTAACPAILQERLA